MTNAVKKGKKIIVFLSFFILMINDIYPFYFLGNDHIIGFKNELLESI